MTNGFFLVVLPMFGWGDLNPLDWLGDAATEAVGQTWTAAMVAAWSSGLWLLIWPAAIGYLLIMLVREAALLLLVATSPIAAGGLMSELGRSWFWRSLRWFLAAVLIAPLAALVLGVGEKISEGVVSGAGQDTTAAVG